MNETRKKGEGNTLNLGGNVPKKCEGTVGRSIYYQKNEINALYFIFQVSYQFLVLPENSIICDLVLESILMKNTVMIVSKINIVTIVPILVFFN